MSHTNVVILQDKANPSTDYFILPQFADPERYPIHRVNWSENLSEAMLHDAIVVIVRYLQPKWVQSLLANRAKIREIIYFIDDDIWDWSATQALPLRYRIKVWLRATRYRRWVERYATSLWVSTPYLQQKYAHLRPKLVSPSPLKLNEQPVCVFYHGSITHHDELLWLYDIIEAVLDRNEHIYVELIGNAEINEHFRALDRVYVVNLMPWPAYRLFVQRPGRHIGLVPLLNNHFNAARSYTKFFDITLAGAVGIYAQNTQIGDFVDDQVDGVVLSMHSKQPWIDAILALASSPKLRYTMNQKARSKLAELVTKRPVD